MSFKLTVFIECVLLLLFATCAQSAAPPYNAITMHTLKKHVVFLSDEALQGRLTGTPGEKRALQYVATVFKQLGLEPLGDHDTYFQCFALTKRVLSNKKNALHSQQHHLQSGCNVLAKLQLNEKNAAVLIIGAHIDHLGHGELTGSRAKNHEKKLIHPGADDNASGVASLLALAAQLSALKAQGQLHGNKDIIFAIWSGEELGLLGSSYYAKQLNKPSWSMIDAYINLDMVGRLKKHLVLQGVGSSPEWQPLIRRVSAKHHLSIRMQQDPYLPTDATTFYLRDRPVLNFFTGAHDDYHTPRDTVDRLNIVGLQRITTWLLDFVLTLTKEQRLGYKLVAKMLFIIGRCSF